MTRHHNTRNDRPRHPTKDLLPETFDHCMDEGVQLEEKGERYATGDKARRFYERAGDMYGRAHAMNPNDADCVYNWGRILYILLDFLPPHTPTSRRLTLLADSIQKFRAALVLDPSNADALFNLAQALATQAELLQSTDDGNDKAAIALYEAVDIFDNAYELQKKHDTPTGDGMDVDTPTATTSATSNNETETTVTEILPITPYVLIDTLVSTASALASLAFLVDSLSSANQLYARATSKLDAARALLPSPSSPDDKTTLAENDAKLCEIDLAHAASLSSLADRTLQETARVDHETYTAALQRLDAVLARAPRNVEALCDRGDLLGAYAQAIAQSPPPTPENLTEDASAKKVWDLHAAALQSFTAAQHCEPRNRDILCKLGDINLARSQVPLPVATRNRTQLLKNAEYFYRQVVELDREDVESGWVGLAQAVWAQGQGEGAVVGKVGEAEKVVRSWRRRGGGRDVLERMGGKEDVMVPGFVEWAAGVLEEVEGGEEK